MLLFSYPFSIFRVRSPPSEAPVALTPDSLSL
jgi:hypothetical protein